MLVAANAVLLNANAVLLNANAVLLNANAVLLNANAVLNANAREARLPATQVAFEARTFVMWVAFQNQMVTL